MSFTDIEHLFDQHAAEGGINRSAYEFVADKFMHTTRTIEETDDKGIKSTKEILDVDARTELNSPIAFAASQTYDDYLARRFNQKRPSWVNRVVGNQGPISMFLDWSKIDMINKGRAGRTETKEILAAYFGGQKLVSPTDIAQEVLKK